MVDFGESSALIAVILDHTSWPTSTHARSARQVVAGLIKCSNQVDYFLGKSLYWAVGG